ncbi:UNVERIFIED_CONTAM: protein NRT1/ PTR FAMILY 4.6 [Sesamum calycinum]|uniref:Protein NRT1/ PTR FAMILY 4.6 n=1 Tax=Sesamum calycinum TaxID=2727403 RepID=A0AAW2SB40_9LAMI
MSTMVLYFHRALFFDISPSANTLTNFLGSTFLLTVLGGFVSDTYLNRLHTCLIFGFLEIMGLLMVTIQANSKKLQPDSCNKPSCIEGGEAVMFYASLCVLALGCGGVKGSIAALGADQFDRKDPKGSKAVASYFNYFQFSTTVGSLIGVTLVVWIALNKGWHWAFFTGLVAAFIGFIILAFGKNFYLFQPLADSPIVRISQVILAAVHNRHLDLPENSDELYEIDDKERDTSEDKLLHTNQFRVCARSHSVSFLNQVPRQSCSSLGRDEHRPARESMHGDTSRRSQDTDEDAANHCQHNHNEHMLGSTADPLGTPRILHGTSLGHTQHPNSFNPGNPFTLYGRSPSAVRVLLHPFGTQDHWPSKRHNSAPTCRHRPRPLSRLNGIAGVVEVKRRDQALKHPDQPISLFWLSFQYGVFGVADMFAMVGLMEFFYKEAPSGMRSLATSFALLSLSFGYFLSTVFVNIVNAVTEKVAANKQGWLQAPDLDHNKLDYFYWFLGILSGLNFVNYLFWASWYKYRSDHVKDSAQNLG